MDEEIGMDELDNDMEAFAGSLMGAQPCPPEEEERDTRMCWSGRPVVNPRLLVVEFDDGSTGMVRKKTTFKPRHGLVMEVRPSEEEGFYDLVGEYRDNGARLDK